MWQRLDTYHRVVRYITVTITLSYDIKKIIEGSKIDDIIQYGNNMFVIAWTCGQTLGLGLGQSKDIVVVFY